MRQIKQNEPIGNFHPSQLKGVYSNRENQTLKGLLLIVGAVFGAIALFVLLYMVKSSLGIDLFVGSPVGEFLENSGICEHFGICHDTLQLK